MSRFIARDIQNVEENFSTIEIKEEGFIEEPIKVAISEDLLNIILELNEKKEEIINGDFSIDNAGVTKSLKGIDVKNEKEVISKTISSVIGSLDFNSLAKNPKKIENEIKDLEAEYFFKIKEIDKKTILNLYCKAINKEPNKDLCKIALLALKTNEVKDDETQVSYNFFQYWLEKMTIAINQQYGIKLSNKENF